MSIVVSILYCHRGEEVQRDREKCKVLTKNGGHVPWVEIYRGLGGESRCTGTQATPTLHHRCAKSGFRSPCV